jgi:ATP-binding cassette subfamily B (MDR/TAP) protein 1
MSIHRLYNPLVQITKAASAAQEIFALIDVKVPDMSGKENVNVHEDIIFRDINFAYPTRPDTTILDRLNVRFEKGKTTAIVGPSGSGKSTIVGLLERWYEPHIAAPDSPRSANDDIVLREEKLVTNTGITQEFDLEPGIFIGQENINQLDIKWWRSNIGLVQQEPYLFNESIYNNVANGLAGTKWEAAPTEVKFPMVQKACKEAYAEEFISRLPQGYDTKVGEGGGMMLSGGQRQRIAIARAIIKDPQILILDEATSAIDIRTERIVQKALDLVSRSRTTITIAHRLSTIKRADKIIVLRGGQVVEQGTHEQLLDDDEGVYSSLVRAQTVETGDGGVEQFDEDAISLSTDMPAREQEKPKKAKPSAAHSEQALPRPTGKEIGFLRGFTLLISEQKENWVVFPIALLSAMTGGCESYFIHLTILS